MVPVVLADWLGSSPDGGGQGGEDPVERTKERRGRKKERRTVGV